MEAEDIGGSSSRKVHRRSDISKGLLRTSGDFIPDSAFAAPHFCIAFELVDKTALPQLAQKAIWAINNAVSCVEKGEEGAYIRGLTGLKCLMGKKGKEKSVIIRETDGVEDMLEIEDGSCIVLKEVEIEVRIHEARSPAGNEDDQVVGNEESAAEYYLFLLVSSPLAFSLRKAVYTTLQLRCRGQDAQYADARRSVWNMLATHVRQGLSMRGQNMHYTMREVERAHDISSIDWIHISSSHSFTRLFSMATSADWVRNHYFSKHPQKNDMILEGFGELSRDRECVEPVHISGCMKYDEDVNKAIAKSNKKRRRNRPAMRGGRGGGAVGRGANFDNGDEEGGEDDDSVLAADDDDVTILVPFGYQTSVGGARGYPSCSIAMKVVVPLTLENQVSLFQFYSHVHSFPASVTLDILKKALGLQPLPSVHNNRQGDVGIGENDAVDNDDDDQLLTLAESQVVVCGRDSTLGRPMLSNGDSSWAIKCEKNVMSLNGDRQHQKVSYLKGFLRLGFGLALTRAMGSDMYENERVAVYGKFIEHSNGSLSLRECKSTCEKSMTISENKRLGCGVHEALKLLFHTMTSCNAMAWSLRPDNLLLFSQMFTSDAMLSLNYHGSVIGGACNGIGATLVVRDGGGSYRKYFKDPSSSDTGATIGQIYSKRNGSGADTCVSMYKAVAGTRVYDPRFDTSKEMISELKRTTELGLMQDSCNIVELHGTEIVQTHCVTETMGRKYSTELKAANDPQSQSCMQAIAWLIPRNTTSTDVNVFKSTRENEKTKARIPVEYRQVIYGYWLICSNSVGNLSRERFRTLVTVSRSIPAAANALNPDKRAHNNVGGRRIENGVQDSSSGSKDAYAKEVIDEARPVFFSSMCTVIVSGFMQWTGMLGKLPSSPVLEALISVFYAQLDLSKDILNPDMFNQGEKPRCLQISKARGVASSLIATSIQETIEAGRLKKGHLDAVEACTFKLMIESTSPAIAPWIMADTMEHMFRLDFLILMQMLCKTFLVPSNIGLSNVQTWLITGDPSHCPSLQQWIQQFQNNFLTRAPLDRRGGLTSLESCLYITHPSLSCVVQDPGMSVDPTVCEIVGSSLFKRYSFPLAQDCQIHESLSGEEVIKVMVTCNVNQQFTWPSVFGDIHSLPNFWLNQVPNNHHALELCPLRIVITEAHRACMCVDIRWLLLISVLGGTEPSQSSRHIAVGQWVQQFYRRCIPDRMVCSRELFLGLPSPVMNGGFVCPPVVKGGRRLLRRPVMSLSNSSTSIVGAGEVPIASGLVEDLGPAAPRYQLAKILKVEERSLPTSCVRYSLPHDLWTPVRVESDGSFGSLKTSNDGVFMLNRGGATEDITAAEVDNDEEVFLDGRVKVDVRPLCVFDRPGIVVHHRKEWAGIVINSSTSGLYKILQSDGQIIDLNPYETEDAVLKIGSKVYIKLEAFTGWKDNALFYTHANRGGEHLGADIALNNVLECRLAIPIDENMAEGTGRIAYRQHTEDGGNSIAFFGSSQIGSDKAAYSIEQSLDVHISHWAISKPAENVTIFLSVFIPDGNHIDNDDDAQEPSSEN